MKKNIRYIIFERPKGSLCWTVAYNDDGLAMQATKRITADALAKTVRQKLAFHGQPTRTYIAKVDLPWTKTDQKIKDEWMLAKFRGVR